MSVFYAKECIVSLISVSQAKYLYMQLVKLSSYLGKDLILTLSSLIYTEWKRKSPNNAFQSVSFSKCILTHWYYEDHKPFLFIMGIIRCNHELVDSFKLFKEKSRTICTLCNNTWVYIKLDLDSVLWHRTKTYTSQQSTLTGRIICLAQFRCRVVVLSIRSNSIRCTITP